MVLSPSNTNLTINLLVVNYVSISCMKRYFISTLLSLTLIALYAPAAHATSLAVTVDITAGCRGTVNGSSSITLPVESTQSSNITIFNGLKLAAEANEPTFSLISSIPLFSVAFR